MKFPTLRPSAVNLLLAGVLVLAVVNLVVLWRAQVSEDEAQKSDDRISAATKAGTKAAEAALSYRYDKLDAYTDAVRNQTAGTFRSEFDEVLDQLTERAKDRQLILQCEVTAVGTSAETADHVDLLIYATQSTRAQGKDAPSVQGVRLDVRMELRSGDWLLTSMDPV